MTDDDVAFEVAFHQSANPNLRGWTDGDEERPVPVPKPANGDPTPEDGWRQPADAAQRQVAPEDEFMEYTLYYGKTGAAHVARARRYEQVRYAALLVAERATPFVLMTNDFKVVPAKTIWGVVWRYLKMKLFGIKKPPGPKKRPLPKY